MDDFNEKIGGSDDDLYEDKDMQKGKLTEEMVNALNFGGGQAVDPENGKKSREERLNEIMTKSKAYKLHAQEIKEATTEYTKQLDEDWGDVAALLKFKVKTSDQPSSHIEADSVFDDILTRLKTESGIKKIIPTKMILSDKEKAQQKRQRLETLQQERE